VLFSLIRDVVDEFGGSDRLANELCDRVGEQFLDAVTDQAREYREEDPSRRLGMTELEAAMRWCPFSCEVVDLGKKDHELGNRYLDSDGSDYANPAGSRCIGSICLMWRWSDPFRGYCGLAGRPSYRPLGEPRRLPNRTPLPRPSASEQADLFDDEQLSKPTACVLVEVGVTVARGRSDLLAAAGAESAASKVWAEMHRSARRTCPTNGGLKCLSIRRRGSQLKTNMAVTNTGRSNSCAGS
jgi:hypothetical protein